MNRIVRTTPLHRANPSSVFFDPNTFDEVFNFEDRTVVVNRLDRTVVLCRDNLEAEINLPYTDDGILESLK